MEKILISKKALEMALEYLARRPLHEVLAVWNAINESVEEVPHVECEQNTKS